MQNDPAKTAFTTKEFADLCGVGKHTLFHYDALGIFSPALRGQNGYRYYSVAQLEVFRVIAMLKELDMPLAQIKAYLDRRSPAELVRLLEEQQAQLDQKMRDLQQMRTLIHEKAALTRQAMGEFPHGPLLREEAMQQLFCTPAAAFSRDRDTAESLAAHVRQCEAYGIYSAYSIGSMLPRAQAAAKNLDGYSRFYTRVNTPVKGVPLHTRPAGRYLTLFRPNGYDNTFESYAALLAYAEAHALPLAAHFYEDVLLDELSVKGYDSYLLQISIQIRP